MTREEATALCLRLLPHMRRQVRAAPPSWRPDLIQTAFLEVWRNLVTYNMEGPPPPVGWMARIARRGIREEWGRLTGEGSSSRTTRGRRNRARRGATDAIPVPLDDTVCPVVSRAEDQALASAILARARRQLEDYQRTLQPTNPPSPSVGERLLAFAADVTGHVARDLGDPATLWQGRRNTVRAILNRAGWEIAPPVPPSLQQKE